MLSNFAQNSLLYIYTHIFFFMLLITWSSRNVQSRIQRDLGEDRVVITDGLVIKAWWKVPTGFTSFKLVYGMPCHLLVELEHKALWVLKILNFDQEQVGEKEEGSNARIERNVRSSVNPLKCTRKRQKVFMTSGLWNKTLSPDKWCYFLTQDWGYFQEGSSRSGLVRL